MASGRRELTEQDTKQGIMHRLKACYSLRNRNVGNRKARRPLGQILEAKMSRKAATEDSSKTRISCSRKSQRTKYV